MKKILFSLLVSLFAVPLLSFADGGLIAPPDYYMYETSQKAAIFYESETQTETMVVSMAFSGNAADFAWILPTPNKPEVVQGSSDIFTNLQNITYNYNTSYDYDYGVKSGAMPTTDDEVTVVEQKTVDYYEISVLTAENKDALVTWLKDNGYQYPEKYAYIFNEYINNNWYFVAAKIIPELATDYSVSSELYAGTATPLQLTFTAKNLVFPMKISQISLNNALNSSQYTGVDLYLITDHRQELTGFTANYADKIKKSDIEDLAINTQGDNWVTPKNNKYFLTYLSRYYYSSSEMNADLFPKDAEKDTKITSAYQWDSEKTAKLVLMSLIFTLIGIISSFITPFALFFLIFSIVYYLVKSLQAKVVFIVLQIVDTFITFCFLALSGVLTFFAFQEMFAELKYSSYLSDEISATAAAIAGVVTLFIVLIGKIIALIVLKKKHKKFKAAVIQK